jgi:hypothetical protein
MGGSVVVSGAWYHNAAAREKMNRLQRLFRIRSPFPSLARAPLCLGAYRETA